MENGSIKNDGLYDWADGATANGAGTVDARLSDNGFNNSSDVVITVNAPTATAYTITGKHAQLADTATFSSTTGTIDWP